MVELGRIVSAYGVRGWIKVQPHSAQALVLRSAPIWWLSPPVAPLTTSASPADAPVQHNFRSHAVKQVRPQGSTVVADLEHIGERDLAESYRGYIVHVSRQFFPKAQPDEFYWVDLIECYVFSHQKLVGQVLEVIDNGAHAILRVARLQLEGEQMPTADHLPQPVCDDKSRSMEILIPFVATHVQHVDIVARRIETDWPLDL